MRATVTSKGRVTIPKEIRELAHISAGTQLDFQISKQGVLTVRPLARQISKLKGIAYKVRKHPISLRAMKKAIEEGLKEKENNN